MSIEQSAKCKVLRGPVVPARGQKRSPVQAVNAIARASHDAGALYDPRTMDAALGEEFRQRSPKQGARMRRAIREALGRVGSSWQPILVQKPR